MNTSTTSSLDWTRLVTPGHTWLARLRRLTPIPLALGLGFVLSAAWVVSDSTAGSAARLAEAEASTTFSFTERLRVAPLATLTGTDVTTSNNLFSDAFSINWDAVQVTFAGDVDAILGVDEYASEVALNLRALEANDALPPQACGDWNGRPGETPTPLVCRKADDAVFVFGTITQGRSFLHVIPAAVFGVYYQADGAWRYANLEAPGFQPLQQFETVAPRFIPAAMNEAFPELTASLER